MSSIPTPDAATSWQVAQSLRRHRSILSALEKLHEKLGDVFRLPLPGFNGIVLVGPAANKFLLIESRDRLRWRAEHDPVTRLLRQGILVTDGTFHDDVRQVMTPALHKNMFAGYVEAIGRCADQVSCQWHDDARIDLLDEMRQIALLILTATLFKEDFSPHMRTLWHDILRTIHYISPGPWLVWPGIPRPGYHHALQRMDTYLYQLIASRRAHLGTPDDLLGALIASGMSDALIRDQLLTMLIAGHDTSTALLAWSLYLLTIHPEIMARVRMELDAVVGMHVPALAHIRQLSYLDCVLKETLRLYPPIHLGSRIAATDLTFQNYCFPAGTRLLYSLYLTHRDTKYWPNPQIFDPQRFSQEHAGQHPAYTFLPFGGGPRNCIGAAFAQVEAKLVLARILQQFEFEFTGDMVHPRMRATLEPHPGVLVIARRRPKSFT